MVEGEIRRVRDGAIVPFSMVDLGKANGIYRSRWVIDGKELLTEAEACVIEISPKSKEARLRCDGYFITALGYDISSIDPRDYFA